MVNWDELKKDVQMTKLNKSLKRFKDLEVHANSDDEEVHDKFGKLNALNEKIVEQKKDFDPEKGLPGFNSSANVSETFKANRKKDLEKER